MALVSSNTSASGDDFAEFCGDQQGSGNDELLEFVAPAAGQFTFSVTSDFDAWLLQTGTYCYGYGVSECAPNQALQIDMAEGEVLNLMLDGPAGTGGATTIDVTQT